MSSRTAKFVSAIFASFLASSPLTTIGSAAGAADDCLAGPKGATPAGGHWYYRIEHPSNRHCWYLGEERAEGREKVSQATPPSSPPAATPISPKPDSAIQRSVADAHAELPAQLPVGQPNRLNTLGPAPAAGTPAMTQSAEPQRSIVASRWPDAFGADSAPATDPAPAKDDPGAAVNASPRTQPAPPVLAASQYAAADLSSETPTYSLQMQLVALAAALVLAAIVGGVIFKFASSRRLALGRIREHRGATWEPTDDDRIVLSADPRTEARSRRRGFARDLPLADDGNDRIAEFFSQLRKRAPT